MGLSELRNALTSVLGKMNRLIVFSATLIFLLGIVNIGPASEFDRQEPASPKVYFSHLFMVLDQETYNAIAEQKFLSNEIGQVELRSVKTNDGESWTGFYIYGMHTYLEFFKSEPGDFSEGSGLGFSVDMPGDLILTSKRLSYKSPNMIKPLLRKRMRDNIAIPWYSSISIGSEDNSSTFWTWIMEIHPDYHRLWYSDKSPGSYGITRKHQNVRRYNPEKYLKDIVEITIELNKKETLILERDLKNLGYEVFNKESFVELKGPEICLKIKTTDKNYRGIIKIQFMLNRSIIENKKIVMGKSVLSFDRYNMATWDFFATIPQEP